MVAIETPMVGKLAVRILLKCCLVTDRKRSLVQDNVFTRMYYSLPGGGGGGGLGGGAFPACIT